MKKPFIVKKFERCRECKHIASAHGEWKYVLDALDQSKDSDIHFIDTIELLTNEHCVANKIAGDYKMRCRCEYFLPQDNLLYLERVYEQKSR